MDGRGATVPGKEGGWYVGPTVIDQVRPDMALAQEEVFGPFVTVSTFADDDEALAIANSTDYGLGGGLWTQNLSRAHRMAGAMRSGMIWVNSYKRLVPGYEAPVLLAYSARNRSASCRIPYGAGAKAKRVEVRFPDAMANPYLAYAALFMAGLDGIENKIHPGDAMDKNLYDLPPEELAQVPTVCGSLREALESLEADHAYLLKGDVFSKDQIESYIELKMEDVARWEMTPSPVEFDMYYSC